MDHAHLMLFQKQYWEPIRTGAITLTFRRWKRPQVVPGRVYRTSAGRLYVDAADVITPKEITDADAQRAGHESAEALVADLRGAAGSPVYRVAFRYLDEPDPRDVLAGDDVLDADAITAIDRGLDRLDGASSHGPWTRQYLRTISECPGVRAPDLAARFGRDTQPFKIDVRKLKNLGLTISLRVGYRISPRGRAYLDHHADLDPAGGT